MILQTQNLSVGYKKSRTSVVVQHNINVGLQEKEVVCLIGPNGCGKSTLLRTLGGLQKPLSGSVFIKDQLFEELSGASKALLIGLVLTEQVSIGKMTVLEMVALGRYPHTGWLGNLSETDAQKVNESIELVHLTHKKDSLFDELSDGEKQRVMIAKALAQDTPIVLFDDPTAHLDLPNRVEIMLLLRKLAKQTGKSILLSTHELDLALQASDKIWLMQQDGIICGLPEELVINGNLQHVFQNKSFNFDEKTGNFVMNYPTGKNIFVTGDEVLCYWTKRALSREGYVFDPYSDIKLNVDSKTSYLLEKAGQKTYFTNLKELLEFLSL